LTKLNKFNGKIKKNHIHELAKKLKTPRAVQTYLRGLPYNSELNGETLRSAAQAAQVGIIHCLEAALLAAAVLELHGYPPLVLSFESQDGLDHVIYIFKQNNRWGAIARSRDEGLHGRAPVYRSLRDLAWSYFDPYIDLKGRMTAYQNANLDQSGTNWRASTKNLWKLERYLLELPHRPLVSSQKRYQRIRDMYVARGAMPRQKNWW
jgi:hypothetical protein